MTTTASTGKTEQNKKSMLACLAIMLCFNNTSAKAASPTDPAWASNLLPNLKAPTADQACSLSFQQFALINGWIAIYGSAHASGWDYTNYIGDDTKGACVATYWYPQQAPPGSPVTGDMMVFANAYRSDCPVDDLTPITDPEVQAFDDNPDLSDTSRLTPRMQTALSCLIAAATAGSPSVGSAYRPPAYNQHLIDVWNKWNELRKGKDSANPACADLKAKVQSHFQRHELLLTQTPVPNSLHTTGEAVDVTINLPAPNIDALAPGCQLRRPKPVADPVHFIHQ